MFNVTPVPCPRNLLVILLLFLFSCTSEDYDAGDGTYSYLIAELGEVYTGSDAQINRFVTDNGENILFAQPYKRDWATTPDSLYRAFVQYDRQADAKGYHGIFSISQVMVLSPRDRDEAKDDLKTDPIGWESMWVSPNHRYLNLSLKLMVGDTGDQNLLHKVGLVCMQTHKRDDGTHEYVLQFYHDQNGIPQYYSATTYVSIPLDDYLAGDELVLTLNTYEGELTRRHTITR